MSSNPFEAPSYNSDIASESTDGEVLAGRFTRFAATFVDGFLIGLVVLPIQYFSGYLERASTQNVSIAEQLGVTVLQPLVMLLIHGYTLINRGQSIGKMLTGIQIVDASGSDLLSFVKVFILRHQWGLPLGLLVFFVPGRAGVFALAIIGLVDALLIFGGDRRCLHDYIAGSRVVMYKEGRKKMA